MKKTLVLLPMVALLLAGCTTPGPQDAPPPRPDETAPDPATTTISIMADRVDLVDASGETIDSFGYFSPPDDLVAALTEAIGEEPGEAITEKSDSFAGSIEYTWNGFTVIDSYALPAEPLSPDFAVEATADAVGDLPISSPDGLKAGDGLQDVVDAGGTPAGESGDEKLYRVAPIGIGQTPDVTTDDGAEPSYSVGITVVDGEVVSVRSPTPNFGP